MAWEARSGLKHYRQLSYQLVYCRLNGLGSPFGIETTQEIMKQLWLLKRINGLGSPFGIETHNACRQSSGNGTWLNGLGSPFGIETRLDVHPALRLYEG